MDPEEERKNNIAQAVMAAHALEEKRKADFAKSEEKEAKKRAKMQLAAWEAEMKRKDAEAAAKKEEEAKKKVEAAAKKKQEEEKKKQEEAKKKVDAAKKNEQDAEAQAKKALFLTPSLRKKMEVKDKVGSKARGIAGGLRPRDHVVAAQDITIRGNLVVMAGTAGIVIGPAESDPIGRVAVDFVKRQDGGSACLNCVPREIRKG